MNRVCGTRALLDRKDPLPCSRHRTAILTLPGTQVNAQRGFRRARLSRILAKLSCSNRVLPPYWPATPESKGIKSLRTLS
jgi:hypothetical protein